jgi:hypothetical protein
MRSFFQLGVLQPDEETGRRMLISGEPRGRERKDSSSLRDTADRLLSRLARAARFKMVVVLVEVE